MILLDNCSNMESLLRISSSTYLSSSRLQKLRIDNRNSSLKFPNPFSSSFPSLNLGFSTKSRSVRVQAKKNKKNNYKDDNHSFVAKPDEASGPFPEAVLLKEKKVQEDGRFLPEFEDDDERELYEFLDFQLQSDLDEDRIRHYEVVYMIHEKHAEEVESVNVKVQEFLKEKKGRIWRLNDWGLRRLAYKIKKANYAHYMLMNFELEAKFINDFKTLLDKDERVIRHLVMKQDKPITEDCPPPPEFRSVHSGMDDDEGDDEEDWDDQEEEEEEEEEEENNVIAVHKEEGDKLVGQSTSARKNFAPAKAGR